MANSYRVYAKVDEKRRITAVNSSGFVSDVMGWTQIDEGSGVRYYLAQNNYFPLPIADERGIYRYKLENGKPVERTQEEMDADYVPPVIEPTDKERIAQLEEELKAAKILLGLEV